MNQFKAKLAAASAGQAFLATARDLGMSDREFQQWADTVMGVAQDGFTASRPHEDSNTGLIDAIVITKG